MATTHLHPVVRHLVTAHLVCAVVLLSACAQSAPATTEPPFIPVGRSKDDGTIRYGYIDAMGKVRIEPRFEEAAHFSDGLARVLLVSGEWGYINESGEVVITLPKEVPYTATAFHEGLALANWGGEAGEIDDHTVHGGKWGYIDITGKFVIPPQFTVERHHPIQRFMDWGFFRCGRALVPVEGGWAYIDRTGKLVISGPFTSAHPFVNGVAETHTSWQKDENTTAGIARYIDAQGRVLWED